MVLKKLSNESLTKSKFKTWRRSTSHFVGEFSCYDVLPFCKTGLFLKDHALYIMGQSIIEMLSTESRVHFVHPTVVMSMVNLKTMETRPDTTFRFNQILIVTMSRFKRVCLIPTTVSTFDIDESFQPCLPRSSPRDVDLMPSPSLHASSTRRVDLCYMTHSCHLH